MLLIEDLLLGPTLWFLVCFLLVIVMLFYFLNKFLMFDSFSFSIIVEKIPEKRIIEERFLELKSVVEIMGCVLIHCFLWIQDVSHGYIVPVLC